MTEEKQLHEGEIWRKQGPMDWCRIDRDETPEAVDVDASLPGFVVSFGNYSFKQKRVYWRSLRYFIAVADYPAFVVEMEREKRYLMKGGIKEQRNEL